MKKTLALILAVIMMLAVASAMAETKITVSGSGTTLVNADYAMVTLGVVHMENDVLKAQEKVNGAINAIRSALIENGIDKEDINTDQVRIYARYDYSDYVEKIVGYSASSYLVIRTDDMENVGSVIDIAFEAGANTLEGIEFFAENTDSAREESLTFAVTDATNKAKIIAKAAGLTITGIESIAEGYSYTSESARNAVFKNYVAEDSAALGQTVVQSAKLSVEASVTMIFIAE
ncbi:MAG: SIMPL domain-containing protein [Clostridia bacterium]|nr:SIMPL domain-containing protein [Clostridia bacterium]